jgi:KEOPS complex subunit Cgi121
MDVVIQGCRDSIPDKESFIAALQEFATLRDIALQAFDAAAIYGEAHLISAVQHAVRSVSRDAATCNDLSMEILLYASGCRQIRDALDRVGIRDAPIILVAVGSTGMAGSDGRANDIQKFIDEHSLTVDERVVVGSSETIDRFFITREEREAIDSSMYEDLILEQVAMVDLQT